MGSKSRDWESIGKYISQIKSSGLNFIEGAKRFGLKVTDIYEYNKRFKKGEPQRGPGKVKNTQALEEYISRIKELGMSYKSGASHFGIDASEIYRHNRRIKEKRYLESSSKELNEIEEKPRDKAANELNNPPELKEELLASKGSDSNSKESREEIDLQLPCDVEELIVNFRKEHPDYGYRRIEEYLKKRYFVVVQRKKIREVCKKHGLVGSNDSSFDKVELEKHPKGSRRFEASYPRELYQMDITYVYLVNKEPTYLVLIVDDHSRFCVANELRLDQKGSSMIEVLHRAIERYGKPSKLLTDQGSSFYSWSREQTIFQHYLDDMGIEHIVANPHSPQTLGKVERLNQTVQQELLNKTRLVSRDEVRRNIESYFHHYNYERPHQGIKGATPSSRFHGIVGEISRVESSLCSGGLDFSRGYLILKMFEHTISTVCNSKGLQVYLDGQLLKAGPGSSNANSALEGEEKDKDKEGVLNERSNTID